MPRSPPRLSVERGHRKAEGQAERELPVGNAGAQPSSDAGVEPDVLRRPRLPDGAEQNIWFDAGVEPDRKSTRLNSSHGYISYAVFCLKKKKHNAQRGTKAVHDN